MFPPILFTTVLEQSSYENNAGNLEIEALRTHTHAHTATNSLITGHGFPI